MFGMSPEQDHQEATLVPDQRGCGNPWLSPMPRKMLSMKQVLDLIPVTRQTLWRWYTKDGTFPKPVPIGGKRVAWYADEVEAWQRDQVR
jgi:prophage regulatory protein